MGRLDGKVAVITGGNSGVGAATAKLFAKEGATVVITARREAALKEVADEIMQVFLSRDLSQSTDFLMKIWIELLKLMKKELCVV